jgi:NAD(P)-dependent dehydrogenase (short-subunit alcohol dehydrogenase family)
VIPDSSPVVVIGGTKGLGRAVSVQVAATGRHVVCVGRSHPDFIRQDQTGRLRFVPSDAQHAGDFENVLRGIAASGPIAGLVLSQRYRGQADHWSEELRVGLEASRIAFDVFEDRFTPGGAVVAVSSAASGRILRDCSPAYHVGKAALEHLVRYYAVKWGPSGVRVNAVAPCVFVKEESSAFYAQHDELTRYYETITPLGRMGRDEETASVIRFLLGPDASFVTGQIITVDGGMSLQDADSVGRALKAQIAQS